MALGGVLSDPEVVKCGIPQGSILGLSFFLTYINDMADSCSSDLFLYTDDSELLTSHEHQSALESTLSAELASVNNWLIDNMLSLHLGKTEATLFGSKYRLNRCSECKVTLNKVVVSTKASVKYLGCIPDNNLDGRNMSNKVLSKVTGLTKFIGRNSTFLNRSKIDFHFSLFPNFK